MESTFIFDITYYILTLMMTVILSAGTVLGLWKSRAGNNKATFGMGLVALGGLITITESSVLIFLSRNSLVGGFLYQQVQFSISYFAFAAVLYGLDNVLFSQMLSGINLKRTRIFACDLYLFSIAGASLSLFNPASYKVTIVGSQVYVAQQMVFWFPLFLVLLGGALTSLVTILRSDNSQLRNYARWVGLFSALVLLGTLRESTLVPSAGDPLVDLLVAFVPFVVGSLCALMGVRATLLSSRNEQLNGPISNPVN
jgi:hypothetical protein